MATVESPAASKAGKKKADFASYLRAIDTDRLNPANSKTKNMADKEEVPLLLTKALNTPQRETRLNAQMIQATGVLISLMWLTGAALYVQRTIGWNNVSSLMPHELGGFMAGILSPVALFWMVAAFILRSNDVKMYAEALRGEIQRMIFPSAEAERRVNNDIERLIRQTAEMSRATKMAMETLKAAREAMLAETNALHSNSDTVAQRIEKLGVELSGRTQGMADVRKQLDEALSAIDARVGSVDATAAKLQTAKTDIEAQTAAVTRAETALQNAGHDLAKYRSELHTEAEGIEEKTLALTGALQKATDDLYTATDDALDKAKLVETKMHGHLQAVETVLSGSHQAAELLEATTLRTAEEAQRVQDVLQSAITRLQQQDDAFAVAAKLLEQRQQQIEAIESGVQKSAAVMRQVLDDTQQMEAKAQQIGQLLDDKATHVRQATQDIGGTVEKFQTAMHSQSQDVALLAGKIAGHFKAATGDLDLQKNLLQVQNEQSEQLASRLRALQDLYAAVTTQSSQSGQSLQATTTQLQQLADTTLQNVQDELDKKLQQLEQTQEHMQTGAQTLADTLGRTVSALQQQSAAAEQLGETTLQRLSAAVGIIGQQNEALEQAALNAQNQSEAMQLFDAKRKRETFFHSAKFVVESLHSLALDFTRLLEGQLDEKDWKAYQKGETGTFTKRLLSSRDEATQEKIRSLYKNDVEFRTYAQRYLRQFEEILESAKANDHGELLSGVFTSSDIGKLYQFLCNIVGREARGKAA